MLQRLEHLHVDMLRCRQATKLALAHLFHFKVWFRLVLFGFLWFVSFFRMKESESPNIYKQAPACIRSGLRAPQAEDIQKGVREPKRIQAGACLYTFGLAGSLG